MRVFLTSDSVTGSRAVRKVLQDQGHLVDDPSDSGAGALMAGTDFQADAAIAVLLAARPTFQKRAAVLVEVGIFIGRAIPTLILSRSGLQLPSLAGVPRIDADPRDSSTLDLKVGLFLQAVRQAAPRKPPATSQVPTVPVPRATIARLASMHLEQKVRGLLEATDPGLVRAEAPLGDHAADYALYLQGPEYELGLVLVEVKTLEGSPDPLRRLREAAHRLSAQVLQARASLGLLVHDGPRVKPAPTPSVAVMHVDELASALGSAALPSVLRRARNQAIHGA